MLPAETLRMKIRKTRGKGKIIVPSAIFLLIVLSALPAGAAAEPQRTVVGYYFTGNGCPHCARVNPVLYGDWLAWYPGLVVVEYEVYGHSENAAVMAEMDRMYGIGLGIPVLFFGANETFVGDEAILPGVPPFQNRTLGGASPGENLTTLDTLDLQGLPGYPRVWHEGRVLIREGPNGDTGVLRELLSGADPDVVLAGRSHESLDPVTVTHGDLQIRFEHALRVDGWVFGWNGNPVANMTPVSAGTPAPTPTQGACPPGPELTAGKIAALAAVNAINPCALAVLVVILLAIITRNPGQREKILLAGIAFSLSVFVFYLAYGLILVSLLAAVRGVSSLQFVLTRALGLVSIAIGVLHIREYFAPGGAPVGTGIPAGWRPRLGEALNRITSPRGAFVVGALVTLFLLPCNIGPYIIGCGILAVYGPLVALPYLLLYNLIFVLPMLAITAVVYLGVARIGDVKGWREQNIGRFHLVSGLIILAFGILLLSGLV
jgi:threonine/homoserine/homoserine lactone efflux protein